MKFHHIPLVLSFSLAALLLPGCNKDEDNPDNNSGTTPEFSYNDAFGVLVAVKSVSYTSVGGFEVPVEANSASAFFPTDAGASTFVDAGTVTIEGKSLDKQSNNMYLYTNYLSPLTLSNPEWNVSGSGNVPSFSKTLTRPLPLFSGYSALPSSISKGSGVTIALGTAVSAADSVIVLIASSNNAVIKSVAGNAASVTFSATELSELSAGNQGSVSVSPYNITTETISSKKFYFVNESSYLKTGIPVTE